MEPWHADIFEFLDLRKNQGKEELRARDLFLALWTNDIFMERVDLDEDWTLMCPHECPGLNDSYGDEFKKLYLDYESKGYGKRVVKARELWNKVLESQVETGTPYILYKDSVNEKSNQANIGVIRSSNLCAEIVESTGITRVQGEILQNKELLESVGLGDFWGEESVNETAVCNLASISLTKFVNKNKTYNYNKLYDVAYQATVSLNNVIDVNYYPSRAAKFSNLLHRPIGLGVQGLSDVFFLMGIGYDSQEAKSVNKQIFETIYFAAMRASCDLSKDSGPYTTYNGSPISQGKFQFDLWGTVPTDRWDWKKLREDILKWGVRNSLTTCIMPTASCQVSSTIIQTLEGNKSYQQIMDEMGINWQEIEKTNEQGWIAFETPLYVKTRFGIKKSEKIFYNGQVETMDIEMEDGTIFQCSENHKFLVNRDSDLIWVRADELEDGDDINNNGEVKSIKVKKVTKSSIKPTWDIEVNDVHEYLLSNGCVSHNTASILGNEASCEAQTSNLYLRRVISGEYIMVNKYLVKELVKLGIWNDSVKNKIIQQNGSVQNVPEIPTNLKEIFKTVWEIKQKDVIDMAGDRGAFIDQTQSMNVFMENVNFGKLTAMHFYGWGKRSFSNDSNGRPIIPVSDENCQVVYDINGVPRFYREKKSNLKTGMYYLRTKSAADAVKFTVQESKKQEEIKPKTIEEQMSEISCSLDDPNSCEVCGS